MKLCPSARVPGEVASRLQGRVPIAAALAAAAIGVGVHTSAAEPAPEDLLPQSELDDPIGVDARTRGVEAAAADAAARAAAEAHARSSDALRYGPLPPPLRTRDGEILTSVRSTREQSHRVDVELDAGLADVTVEIVLTTPVDKPAEVRYRLAVPAGAELASLKVCNVLGCRTGVVDPLVGAVGGYDDAVQARGPEGAPPIAHAVVRDDARGRAIVLRAAPVVAGRNLTLHVRYLAGAPVHDGSARFTLPARGMDPYAAPTTLRVHAPTLVDTRIAGAPSREDAAAAFDPWVEVPVAARVPTNAAPRVTLWTFPCGVPAGRCARAHVAAGPSAPAPREVVLALDVSPSTEGPARARLLPAVAAVLATAPEGSRVRIVVFAGRARVVVAAHTAPASLPWSTLGDALDAGDLGSATRFEAVWELARKWFVHGSRRAAPALVLLGDGGLTEGDARPFRAARRAGVEVSVVNVADRATLAPLANGVHETGGVVVEAGAAADAAARGRDTTLLEGLVGAIFAPVVRGEVALLGAGAPIVLGALRAGHELAWQGRVRGRPRLRNVSARARPAPEGVALALASAGGTSPPVALAAVDARDLRATADAADRPPAPRAVNTCDRRGPARRHGGVNGDLAPIALAEDRPCRPASQAPADASADVGRGMPADPLLGMLRQRIVPVARGCFRRERAGRPDHAVRAVFAFTLADREIVSARVEGEIPEALRACLLGAVDSLDVPRFSGVVRVRYPLRTERAALPGEIELTASTAAAVDTLIEDEPASLAHQRAADDPGTTASRARKMSASDASGGGGEVGSSSSKTSPRGGSK